MKLAVAFLYVLPVAAQQPVYLEDVPGYWEVAEHLKRVTGILEVHRPAAFDKLKLALKSGDENKISRAYGELEQVEQDLRLYRNQAASELVSVETTAETWFQNGKLTERSYDRSQEFAVEVMRAVQRSHKQPRGYGGLLKRAKPVHDRVLGKQQARDHSPI